jgi:hypothetical protein
MKRWAAAVLAFASLGMVLVATGGTTAGTSTPPGWQRFAFGFGADSGRFFRPLGYASGRVWYAVQGLNDNAIWSARVQGGAVTSFVSTPSDEEHIGQSSIVGSNLVHCCTSQPGGNFSETAPLLANGKIGPWAPIPGVPEQVVRQKIYGADQGVGSAQGAVTIGGRTVWAVAGAATLGACCTAAGEATDLRSLLKNPQQLDPFNVRLGLDAQGRLWLGWSERQREPNVTLHLARLDPATLTPLGATSYGPAWHGEADGANGDADYALVCADTCRLVFGNAAGFFAWDGSGQPVKLLAGDTPGRPHLLGAGYRAGALTITYLTGNSDRGWQLSLAEGDTQGRNVHTVATTEVPLAKPHPNETWIASDVASIFTPSGYVAAATYHMSGLKVQPVLGTVLRAAAR